MASITLSRINENSIHTHEIDTELSTTSTNPVRNSVITEALSMKSNTDHEHTKSQITDFSHTHDDASITTAGFMSREDKTKLNGIATEATANVAASAIPKDLGIAAVGSSTKYAREDHVHKQPTAREIGALYWEPLIYDVSGNPTIDIDNLTTDGIYASNNLGGTLPSIFGDTQGQLLVLDYNGYWATQIIRSPHMIGLWMRKRYGSTAWGTWQNIADGGKAESVSSSGPANVDSSARSVWVSNSADPDKRVTSSLTFREDIDMLTTNISGTAASARNISSGTSTPSSLANGNIYLVYS